MIKVVLRPDDRMTFVIVNGREYVQVVLDEVDSFVVSPCSSKPSWSYDTDVVGACGLRDENLDGLALLEV